MARFQLEISLLFCFFATLHAASISVPSGATLIRNKFAFTADKGLLYDFAHKCVDQKYYYEIKESTSIETLIDLIERLEDIVANTTDLQQFNTPDKVARMILHRFHMDNVYFKSLHQDSSVEKAALIDTHIMKRLTNVESDYYFPDYIYKDHELCTMLFMFSHIFLSPTQQEIDKRSARATYNFPKSNDQFQQAQASPYLDTLNTVTQIQEKGVVSFRANKEEAIAPAKVLTGVIAGLTENPLLVGSQIVKLLNLSPLDQEVNLKDGVLAVTLGNLVGQASFYQTSSDYDSNLVFGVSGNWVNETCCTYYGLNSGITNLRNLRTQNRGSLAQIRGGLDGYIIGKSLENLRKTSGFDAKKIKLSTILKSYYSLPHVSLSATKLGVSYCDRNTRKPTLTEINEVGQAYNQIYKFYASLEKSDFRNENFGQFVDKAATTNDICKSPPSGNLDKNSPCETPSDIIFIVDFKQEEINRTQQAIMDIASKINKLDRYAGSVSVFANSQSHTTVELPSASGGWPLGALIFNSSSLGSLACDLKTDVPLTTQTNLGKYLHTINQTLFNYKYYTPRKSLVGIPSTNVILIQYQALKLANSGSDRDEYNTYKDALKYRNREVRFLVISNTPDNFKEFVKETADIVSTSQLSSIGQTFASKICENPATLTYNDFHQHSQNYSFEGFVTPGYKQNWALYPEYFLTSSRLDFMVKALEGSIKVCYDRYFPPEKTEQCKDLTENSEEHFTVWSPCEDQSMDSCRPVYFTVWGKDRSTPCTDIRCLSLDQVKFSIVHTGAVRSGALNLASIVWLQIICLVVVWINKFQLC